tara:strand:- start:1 stop:192 length:192 start_codon:yes stop_codon:yes gene_type:complete
MTLFEKNKRHYGTWGLFRDGNHFETYIHEENAEAAIKTQTDHDRKNGRNTVYTMKEIEFQDKD